MSCGVRGGFPDNVEWREPAADEIAPVLRDTRRLRRADRIDRRGQDLPSLLAPPGGRMGRDRGFGADDRRPARRHLRLHHILRRSRCSRDVPRERERSRNCMTGSPRAEGVVCESVPSDQWQRVSSAEDRLLAEQKLDQWLVKPTDGVFARMNRKVSIPISRQLIKFPITPNMVSLFTLGVSFSGRRLLRARRPRKHVVGRDPIGFREHSGRLRRRGGPADVPGIGIRLLVGNGLRLPVLHLHLRRDDDWVVGQRSGLHGSGARCSFLARLPAF